MAREGDQGHVLRNVLAAPLERGGTSDEVGSGHLNFSKSSQLEIGPVCSSRNVRPPLCFRSPVSFHRGVVKLKAKPARPDTDVVPAD